MKSNLITGILLSSSVLFTLNCVAAGGSGAKYELASSSGCPVHVEVQQQMVTPRVYVAARDGENRPAPTGSHPAYSINLRSLNGLVVTGGTADLVGTVGATVLSLNRGDREALSRERVTFASADGELQARHLDAVRWVELRSLTYSDGTKWQESSGSVCRVHPNLFVPVI